MSLSQAKSTTNRQRGPYDLDVEAVKSPGQRHDCVAGVEGSSRNRTVGPIQQKGVAPTGSYSCRSAAIAARSGVDAGTGRRGFSEVGRPSPAVPSCRVNTRDLRGLVVLIKYGLPAERFVRLGKASFHALEGFINLFPFMFPAHAKFF
jgi:hypothetical protein